MSLSLKRNKRSKNNRSDEEMLINEDTPFAVTEAYKMLRTNILFSAAALEEGKAHSNAFVISSSVPGEGKSTTSANLSIAFAQTNARVLLIDADMRKPVQHTRFRTRNSYGLSTCLVSIDRLTEAIHHNVRPGLDLLSAGPTPPNPSELLSSSSMKKLLDIVCKVYDYVLIDTPPINMVSDALTFAGNTAGLLLVARAEFCRHMDIRRSLDSIELSGVHMLGVILDDVRHSGGGYYRSYSRYEYGDKRTSSRERLSGGK